MKKAVVVWTAEALIDLEDIYGFIADNSVKSAGRIISALLERIRQLENFPESGLE